MDTGKIGIKAIDTVYNGYKFRSRLEARWAVFFDAMNIKYEYEPEGYEFEDGTKYLPDFKIFVRHRSYYDEWEPVYVEVKGIMTPYDLKKIDNFSKFAPILIVGNIPADCDEAAYTFNRDDGFWSFRYMDGDEYHASFSVIDGTPWICGWDHDEWDGGKAMNNALIKARQARFEHGETPSPGVSLEVNRDYMPYKANYEIIEQAERAKNGEEFKDLYSGKWKGRHNNRKEADYRLCSMLWFYSGNIEQTIKLFKESGLGKKGYKNIDYVKSTVKEAARNNMTINPWSKAITDTQGRKSFKTI